MSVPKLLAACPLFFEIYDREIEKIVRKANVLSFKKNDHVIRDGDEGNEIFLVLEGDVTVQKDTGDGLVVIQQLHPGDIFGEMVLVDERRRSADVVVSSAQAFVLELGFDKIYELFRKEPKIFGLMQLNLARLIAKRLRNSNKTILEMRQGNEAA